MPWAGRSDPLDKDVISILKDDFKSDNSDKRDEEVTRQQLQSEIAKAQIASRADPEDPEKLLTLAEAYGILDPFDPRCFNVADKLCRFVGAESLHAQRRGDAFLIYGRQLFLKDRFGEAVEYMEKAKKLYQNDGTFRKRRDANVGLLRGYAALGKSKEAADRLEVALTLCEDKDDPILMYTHAKNAIEKNGVERDAEVLDDIWFVYLDTHAELKARFESFPKADQILKQCGENNDMDWRKGFHDAVFKMDPKMATLMTVASFVAVLSFVMLMILQLKS
jgi:tetratricopeptide (TPR) repeat protein